MNMPFFSNWWCSLSLCVFCLLLPWQAKSQEIDADVTVDRRQVDKTSPHYLDNLPAEIETYLDEYAWTDTQFGAEERVRVDIRITLLSVDDNFNFDAQVVFRSRRPIYNTTRETVLFFYNEKD